MKGNQTQVYSATSIEEESRPAWPRLYPALFLFLLAIYLLTYTPRINSSDGLAMFSTAESLVRRGGLDIEQIRWMGLQQGTYGLDGLLYSRKGVGVPVGLLPLTWLGLMIPWFGTVGVSLLFNAIVTALTGVLLLAYLHNLGYGRRTGLIVALTFGLLTLAWPYAKSLFSDPFSGLLLLASAYLLLKFRQRVASPGRLKPLPSIKPYHYPFLAGLLLGWNVATRYAEALFLPVFGLLLLYYLYDLKLKTNHVSRSFVIPVIAFLTPILLVGLALIAFNLFRYGDPFNTGYLPNETFSAVLWQGVLGQLISPGRGLLLFCPIFFLSLAGLLPFFRRFPAEAGLALAVILIHLFLYGKWFMWHGGFAWGPRFMVPTLPFWAIFLAPVAARAFPNPAEASGSIEQAGPRRAAGGNRLRLLYLVLAGVSLIPQLLAVTIDFTPFQGFLLETGHPLFAPPTFFDPRYSPLLRAWQFIRPATLDLAWAWQGQWNGWLLAVLLANIGLAGYYLKRAGESTRPPNASASPPHRVAVLSTLMAAILLLNHTHTLPAQSLHEAVTVLNQAGRPEDAVIINHPEITMAFAELYKGRAPVLGLNQGNSLPADIERRLSQTMAQHPQVWWLPNWLPPAESAIEQKLLATGFRARNDNFGGQRLALFATPNNLDTWSRPVNATFEEQIGLLTIAYPPSPPPGTAYPVQLRWRAEAPVTRDYHVFIHLVAGDGHPVAQADGQPALWTRPTSTWTAGEIIIDRHGLWLPPETPAGSYLLRVGLYHPPTGQRLTLSDGADGVEFEITIK